MNIGSHQRTSPASFLEWRKTDCYEKQNFVCFSGFFWKFGNLGSRYRFFLWLWISYATFVWNKFSRNKFLISEKAKTQKATFAPSFYMENEKLFQFLFWLLYEIGYNFPSNYLRKKDSQFTNGVFSLFSKTPMTCRFQHSVSCLCNTYKWCVTVVRYPEGIGSESLQRSFFLKTYSQVLVFFHILIKK